MIKETLLTASMALLAPQPLYVPAKPAIVKASDLGMSSNMLLGMPITLGMLAGNKGPSVISSNAGLAWGGSTVNPSTTIDVPSGTGCVVVVCGNINSSNDREVTAVTFNGTSMTNAFTVTQTSARPHVSIWYMTSGFTPGGSGQTLALTSSSDRFTGASVYFLSSITGIDITASANTGSSNTAVTPTGTSTVAGLMITATCSNGSSATNPAIVYTGDVTSTAQSVSATANSNARTLASGYSASGLAAGSRSVTSTPTNSSGQTCAFVIFK